MARALYRKYRSKNLDEIVGQDHITRILKKAIETDTLSHAYLLTGPRGVGKTSIARILAHEINRIPYTDESTHIDIIEIDAASHTSVDDVRELREKAQIAPTSSRKKIYIIDEVHMLSKAAFNALLKILEEPPEHIVFILATTDVEKLPATILSRVQRFNFRTVKHDVVAKHLGTIAQNENIKINDDALFLVAKHGQGSFRDSITLLDQLRNLSDDTITAELIQSVLGLANDQLINELIDSFKTQDLERINSILDEFESEGVNPTILATQIIHEIRPRIVSDIKLSKLLDNLTEVSRSSWPYIKLLLAFIDDDIYQPSKTSEPRTKNIQTSAKPARKPSNKPNEDTVSIDTKTEARQKPEAESRAEAKTPDEKPEPKPKPKPKPKPSTKHDSDKNEPFPWEDFTSKIRTDTIGVATLLNQSHYKFDGDTLLIYAGKKFVKNKLDKSLSLLSKISQELGFDIEITITDQSPPPKSQEAADIINIMGGGEEVKL